MKSHFFNAFISCWQRYPALLYGLSALLGCGFALHPCFSLIVPALALFISCTFIRCKGLLIRSLIAAAVGVSSFYYVHTAYLFPDITESGISGTAEIEINSLSSVKRHYGHVWVYRCTLKSFFPDQSPKLSIARHTPIILSIPDKEGILRPPANCAYQIHGTLKKSSNSYTLKVPAHELWHPLQGTHSLAEWRFHVKKAVKDYLSTHIHNLQSSTFLQGIATGEFDDNLLMYEFSRFGLQHIMAISGFHFAIVASILCAMLRLLMPSKFSISLVLLMLTFYFIFLGSSASILRSWLMITIAFGSILIHRQSFALNSLGAALLLITAVDPLMVLSLGFQFSFVTTASILLLHPLCDALLNPLFSTRSLGQAIAMNSLNQHAYCLLIFLRKGLALTLAVNITALPMTLFYFQKFPLLSLLYNLFFPFLVSFSMLLLILAFLFPYLHSINNAYTQLMLNFTYNIPTSVDVYWRTSFFSADWLIVYLTCIFVLGIVIRFLLEKKREELQDLVLV